MKQTLPGKRETEHTHTAPLITHTQSDARPHSTLTVSHFRCHSRTANYILLRESLFGACATLEKKKTHSPRKRNGKQFFAYHRALDLFLFLVYLRNMTKDINEIGCVIQIKAGSKSEVNKQSCRLGVFLHYFNATREQNVNLD
jgi:hypothetical protein